MSGPLILSFTQRGAVLARHLAEGLGGQAVCAHGTEGFSLHQWTEGAFAAGRDLIFVGAVGIAVRAVAPFLKSKATDPAVVAVDECGTFAVPVVSGHLGGANALARQVARLCGATPVITTATDVHGRFAVDLWAKKQNCRIPEPSGIKKISSRVLEGLPVGVWSRWPIAGTAPKELTLVEEDGQVVVDVYRRAPNALAVVPCRGVLGVGCRRGTERAAIERVFAAFCAQRQLWPECVTRAATVDRKLDEPGLLDFCKAHSWPLTGYSAEELNRVAGEFTASDFVKQTIGVDNVCERSCAHAAGGAVLERKFAQDGVTLALALEPVELDWRWRDE